jgi:2-polyprenyl-3-methyl-5-hydroxy-6-metoxy-1,4-benzoquinol methylase
MTWEYQSNFSELYPEAAIPEARRRKAVTILRVIEDYFGAGIELSSLRVLDVGASTGVMDRVLAEHFGYVLGLDIDRAAIERAMVANDLANLEFRVGNGLALDIPAESFDVVICAHVYEHVPDPDRLLSEIWRVLKPGGLCYFAAGNRPVAFALGFTEATGASVPAAAGARWALL